MKILITASYNKGRFAPFITEQAEALRQAGCEVEFFGVKGHGIVGYLKAFFPLRKAIRRYQPDVIHAHYGLSGLLANLQRRVPVVTTYHGSDINEPKVLRFSKLAMRMSVANIFVSKRTMDIALAGTASDKAHLIPCGIDLSPLQLTGKTEAIEALAKQGIPLSDQPTVLFAGAFDNRVKNAPLAKEAVALIPDADLIELKGYSREQVTLLMCAADCFLLTSFTEGSPQVIKEALACGCPIVSVDVGDVAERTEGVEGCYVAPDRVPETLAELIRQALKHEGKTKGREAVIANGLDNKQVAEKLLKVYESVIRKNA